jgi:hypothetical protein
VSDYVRRATEITMKALESLSPEEREARIKAFEKATNPPDVKAIKARHFATLNSEQRLLRPVCGPCGTQWPCDAAALLSEVERLRDAFTALEKAAFDSLKANADESRALLRGAAKEIERLSGVMYAVAAAQRGDHDGNEHEDIGRIPVEIKETHDRLRYLIDRETEQSAIIAKLAAALDDMLPAHNGLCGPWPATPTPESCECSVKAKKARAALALLPKPEPHPCAVKR